MRTATQRVSEETPDQKTPQDYPAPPGTPEDDEGEMLSVMTTTSSASTARPTTSSATRNQPSYDSLVAFECMQKASALRVLAKTLDRQRDVSMASGSNAGTNESVDIAASELLPGYRKTSNSSSVPRKLRPLGREYSGPF